MMNQRNLFFLILKYSPLSQNLFWMSRLFGCYVAYIFHCITSRNGEKKVKVVTKCTKMMVIFVLLTSEYFRNTFQVEDTSWSFLLFAHE